MQRSKQHPNLGQEFSIQPQYFGAVPSMFGKRKQEGFFTLRHHRPAYMEYYFGRRNSRFIRWKTDQMADNF
jgi:hypothetical protein